MNLETGGDPVCLEMIPLPWQKISRALFNGTAYNKNNSLIIIIIMNHEE